MPLSPADSQGMKPIFGNAINLVNRSHETILQVLNRWLTYEDGNLWLGLENFKGTEPLWDQVPLIFAQTHPAGKLVDEDLEAALASVQTFDGKPGRLCGNISRTAIPTAGQPRLSTNTQFTDKQVDALDKEGKLALSTSFWAKNGDEGHLDGQVIPNHVLVFVQDEQNQPRDPLSMFLNKEGDGMNVNNIGKTISQKNAGRFKAALDTLRALFSEMTGAQEEDEETQDNNQQKTPENQIQENKMPDEVVELKNKVTEVTKALEGKEIELANKGKEIEILNNKVKELTAEVETARKEKADASWIGIKNKLAPGLLKEEGSEAKLREMFEKDAVSFANMILDTPRGTPSKEEGSTYNNAETTEHLAAIQAFKEKTGRA